MTGESVQLEPIEDSLDLIVRRVIRAPRAVVWRAWTEPEFFEQWWTPAPTQTRVERFELRPGGAFVTSMSDDGVEVVPHTDGVFLAVEEHARIVFTNAVSSVLRPVLPAPLAIVGEFRFEEHADGTQYTAIARHADAAARALHEELGFFEGWGAVTEALAGLAERIAAR